MTRDEAKLILQVCRPGEAAGDPQVAEALALVKADSELAAWHAEEQRWDAVIRRELKNVPAPVDLKADILAQAKLREARLSAMELPKMVDLPKNRGRVLSAWRSPLTWAMAAAIFIVLGLAGVWLRPAPSGQLAEFAHDMIAASPMGPHHMDMANTDLAQVKGWLADHQAVADIELPPAIRNAPGLMGCRIMAWHDHQVSMLCFLMNGSQHIDLFVTPANGIGGAPDPGKPQFAMVDHQITASWTEGGKVYLMTGKVPESFLRHCLDVPATAKTDCPAFLAARIAH